MRFKRYITLATLMGATLMTPASAPAANKDMMDLQRDVADTESKVDDLQKAMDTKLTALNALVQQALDASNKANSSVNSLNSGMMQAIQNALKGLSDQLSTVSSMSVKLDNTSNDVSDIHNTIGSLQVSVNKIQSQITDLQNQIKLLATPAAPPPGAETTSSTAPGSSPIPGVPAATPPPSPQTLFEAAQRDQNSGNKELAISEYNEFLRRYPNDGSAIRAEFNIGDAYYALQRWDDSLKALNAAIEQYDPDPATTPSAYYMKGLILKKQGKTASARQTFNDLIKQFPASDEAKQAKAELRTLPGSSSAKKR